MGEIDAGRLANARSGKVHPWKEAIGFWESSNSRDARPRQWQHLSRHLFVFFKIFLARAAGTQAQTQPGEGRQGGR